MKDIRHFLKQSYEISRALIIGINQYQRASPLEYAVSDAEEMKNILINELRFEIENVIYLTDSDATKSNILKSFLSFTSDKVKVDDRLLVFFAGHGCTKKGYRGEVGYLVPYDADMDDCSSFIRWDELTRNAELIRAKHILFIMDACYGGLAVSRDVQAGSSRFLKDMYQRISRQVITAGKANEVVSDSGGPIPNHSVFTGHLIEGIRGKAANEYGVITANGLMAYVYTKVSNDLNSEQTPHYGQFDGDGDFIIVAPNINELTGEEKKDLDELMSIPYVETVRSNITLEEKINYTKELLSSQKSHIKLYDFTIEEVRSFLSNTSEDNFVLGGSFSTEEFLERISSYEKYTKDIGAISAVITYWATDSELEILRKIVSRMSDRLLEFQGGGVNVWLNLQWYPLLLLLYQAGIAAVGSKNYKALSEILYIKLDCPYNDNREPFIAQKTSNTILDFVRMKLFNHIPGYEKKYTPMSDYLFKQLQPFMDDLFFLGKGYESIFDEFEVLYALVVADLNLQSEYGLWGPIGRFGWKFSGRGVGNSPFTKLVLEAESLKDQWPPLKAGMFEGSYERFIKVANSFKELLEKLNWY